MFRKVELSLAIDGSADKELDIKVSLAINIGGWKTANDQRDLDFHNVQDYSSIDIIADVE